MNRLFAPIIALLLLCAPAGAQQNDFYVSMTGIDALSCVQAAPCRTINYATQQALRNNPNCSFQTVHLGPGAWSESVVVTAHCNQLMFSGAGAGQTTWDGDANNCGVLIASTNADVLVQNMKMQAIGNTCQSILFAQSAGIIQIVGGITFDATWAHHMHVEGSGSQILIWADYRIVGGASVHIAVVGGGHVGVGAVNVTIDNGPTFNFFMLAWVNSSIAFGARFTGPVTNAQKYFVTLNSTIWSQGSGCDSIPGNGAQAVTNGICE